MPDFKLTNICAVLKCYFPNPKRSCQRSNRSTPGYLVLVTIGLAHLPQDRILKVNDVESSEILYNCTRILHQFVRAQLGTNKTILRVDLNYFRIEQDTP